MSPIARSTRPFAKGWYGAVNRRVIPRSSAQPFSLRLRKAGPFSETNSLDASMHISAEPIDHTVRVFPAWFGCHQSGALIDAQWKYLSFLHSFAILFSISANSRWRTLNGVLECSGSVIWSVRCFYFAFKIRHSWQDLMYYCNVSSFICSHMKRLVSFMKVHQNRSWPPDSWLVWYNSWIWGTIVDGTWNFLFVPSSSISSSDEMLAFWRITSMSSWDVTCSGSSTADFSWTW